jgi:putative heme-binding domain-containing protein
MLAKRTLQVFGRVRDADKDKLKVIGEKKKMILGNPNPPDLKAGHKIAQEACFNCHKMHGEGADVGPDLTGVGRSSLDALLAHIIDPNQIIGAGYENVEVETNDGRIVSGRLIENTDTRVRILSAGPKEDVVAKSDIETMRVSELSVMPEGLEQMPDADFRNMIAYILNPPQDNQPFSWKDGSGAAQPNPPRQSSNPPRIDWESVSLWNPEWQVIAPEFEGTPRKISEHAGRKNVLMTHPFSREKGSALERDIAVPAGKRTHLAITVAAHEQGDWQLRALAGSQVIHQQIINRSGETWREVKVDLTPFAGQTVKLRLENAANDWNWEFAYWAGIQLHSRE